MTERATRLSWGDLLRGMGRWLRHNLPQALVMSALSFAFGWVVNFWVMAFRYDGFRAPTGQSDYITAQNSLLAGSLFWAALSSFLFAVLSYGHRAGWGTLREEVFSLPGRIGAMFRGEERNRSLTTLAWAIALSLLLALVISPGVAAVTAGFFLFFAATPLGDLLAGVIRRLWMQLVARFSPHKGEPTSEVGAAAVTAAGMLGGFVIAATVDITLLKALAVVLAALAAYYFANEDELGPSGGTAVFLLMAAAVGLYELFEAGVGVAFADDGGWSECGNCNIIDYITSTGATEVVSRSVVAGGASAVGAPVGAAIGDVLGSFGGSGGTGGTGGGDPTGGAPGGDGGARPTEPSAAAGSSDDDLLGGVAGGRGTVDTPAGAGTGGDAVVTTAGDVTPAPAPQRRTPAVDGGDATDTPPPPTSPPPSGDTPAADTTDMPPPASPSDDIPASPSDDPPASPSDDPPASPSDDPPASPSDDDLLGGVAGGRGTVDAPSTPPPPPGGTAEVPPQRRQPPEEAADVDGNPPDSEPDDA